jgi:hypothetical protein
VWLSNKKHLANNKGALRHETWVGVLLTAM